MRNLLAVALTLLLLPTALAATVSAEEPRPQPAYLVIVHPKNPRASVERRFLQDAFLKKTRSWPNHKVIRPVDAVWSSSVRKRFSEAVIGRSVAAVRAYWQQRIFTGRDVPPPELDSDAKIVAYVLRHEGAVGYVSGTAELGAAKVVSVR
jgi:hypothetical protein